MTCGRGRGFGGDVWADVVIGLSPLAARRTGDGTIMEPK
jgi:hypothetical protein